MRAIYMASRSRHGQRWRDLRAQGFPVSSTWIDESGEGETDDWCGLWVRCFAEVQRATAMICYAEPGEVLRGALAEMGVALAHNVPVYYTGPVETIGNLARAEGVFVLDELEDAMALALAQPLQEQT